MNRHDIIDKIGREYLTSNIEAGEYSYVKEAGGKENLDRAVGRPVRHYKLDIRFELGDITVLVETKQSFVSSDEDQLREYLDCERALHGGRKCVCMLANTNNNKIKVWQSFVDDEHVLQDETVIDRMDHYARLFSASRQNDREKVLKNTYALNELLHKMDIDEDKRSQFVGTTLLYIKAMVNRTGAKKIDNTLVEQLNNTWNLMTPTAIRGDIEGVLNNLLDGSENKAKKVELLQKDVLNDQKVRRLKTGNWIRILDTILTDIYKYINIDSAEGQDILNLFFIAFNKYTGKSDKNQAFTPDHITDFMCRLADVDRTKVVMDICCGSGSFLVQAMVKELADCRRDKTEAEALALMDEVKKKHIFGIEIEEKAYGLSTTNMLIHGDGNSNIKFGSCFESADFIKSADPDIILMNPPYNAKPIGIPEKYKTTWGKAKDGKEDPTKGMVFIHFLSDVIKEMNEKREREGKPRKIVKLAVLLPVSAAIGNSSSLIPEEKNYMLEDNTLEAVFTLPNEMFYPGSSVCPCCMVFSLGKPHKNADGTVNETFFGYYKEDGFKKKKNLGRIEQFDSNGSIWREIESRWLKMYRNKQVIEGLSASAEVTGNDEWLCEAYMKTDYRQIRESDYQRVLNNYCAYLVKNGKYPSLSHKESTAPDLNADKWKRFYLGRIFTIRKGKRLTAADQEEGTNIYIGAIDSNNGVANYIGQAPIHKGNTISLSYNGSVGEAFYQPDPYWATDDVNALYSKYDGFNAHIGLFLVATIRQEQYRFSYGRKWTLDNMKATDICLPIQHNADGSPVIDETKAYSDDGFIPDWHFMENYIKALPYGDRI